jgi:PIN like domain
VRLLLDEDTPVQLLEPLRRFLPGHHVDHVEGIGWKGKQDRNLFADAAQSGYEAFLTNDQGQLDDPLECRAIRDSGMHHIRYRQETGPRRGGLDGLAFAMGAVVAAIRFVVTDLERVDGQRLVLIRSIAMEKRHELVDPEVDPPPYWPSGRGQSTRKRRSSRG